MRGFRIGSVAPAFTATQARKWETGTFMHQYQYQ